MKKAVHIVALLAAATTWTLVVSAHGTSAPPPGERPQTTPTLALVGCVERIEPPARRAGETAPPPPPAYKLVDVQPGPGQRAPQPVTAETQYLLSAPASIKLSDFQNQRVEVTGTLGVTAKPPASEQRGATPGSTLPASTLNVMTVKVVSTECKPPRVTFR